MENVLFDENNLQDNINTGDSFDEIIENQTQDNDSSTLFDNSNVVTVSFDNSTKEFLTNLNNNTNSYELVLLSLIMTLLIFLFLHFAFVDNKVR